MLTVPSAVAVFLHKLFYETSGSTVFRENWIHLAHVKLQLVGYAHGAPQELQIHAHALLRAHEAQQHQLLQTLGFLYFRQMRERAADKVREDARSTLVLRGQLDDPRQDEAVKHALRLHVQGEEVNQLLHRRGAEVAKLVEKAVDNHELLLCLALMSAVAKQRAVHSSVHRQLFKISLEVLVSAKQGLAQS